MESSHLRELATGGWVVRAPERNRDRRESWWRAVVESTGWDPDLFDGPADRAIAEGLSHSDEGRRHARFRPPVTAVGMLRWRRRSWSG